jgi:hypothetical protein
MASVVLTIATEAMTRRLRSDFDDLLARRGLAVRSFARTHQLSHQTLFALLRPDWQPAQRTHGGMRKDTAWKLANAWAKETGQTPDAAYAQIIIDDTSADR